MNISCFILLILTEIGDLSHTIYNKENGLEDQDYLHHYWPLQIIRVTDTFYFIASIMLYILFMGRIYFTFKNTVYAMKNSFIIFILLIIITSIVFMTLYLVKFNDEDFNHLWPYIVTIMANEAFIGILISALFIYKLRHLIVSGLKIEIEEKYQNEHQSNRYKVSSECMIKENQSMDLKNCENITNVTMKHIQQKNYGDDMSEVQSNLESPFAVNSKIIDGLIEDSKQKKMISYITRHTILSVTAIAANFCFYGMELVNIFILKQETNASFQIIYAARSIEIFIDCVVMHLAFRFNNELYYKYCNCCHQCCYKFCLNCTKYAVVNINNNENYRDNNSVYERSGLTATEEHDKSLNNYQ